MKKQVTEAPKKTTKPAKKAAKQPKVKTIELSELEAEKARVCIMLLANETSIKADKLDRKLDRKGKATDKELEELDHLREVENFYSALAKKFK